MAILSTDLSRSIVRHSTQGFSMIEVLVTLLVLTFGLLGAVGLMSASQKAELESYQRVQAIILLEDMVGRINANRKVASCYAISDLSLGTAYLGTNATATVPVCAAGTPDQNARAASDLTDWNNALLGSSEILSGNNTGAMIGARGCVAYDAINKFYLVSVVWQGLNSTIAANTGLTCASAAYSSATQRRVVSAPVKIAIL